MREARVRERMNKDKKEEGERKERGTRLMTLQETLTLVIQGCFTPRLPRYVFL